MPIQDQGMAFEIDRWAVQKRWCIGRCSSTQNKICDTADLGCGQGIDGGHRGVEKEKQENKKNRRSVLHNSSEVFNQIKIPISDDDVLTQ